VEQRSVKKLEDKQFYYIVTWDEAAYMTKALHAMEIPHTIESPGNKLEINEGELAIVFPNVPMQKYVEIRELFGFDGMRYPH
jgi:hypothetical protein